MNRKLTTEEWILKANLKHNNYYNYSKVDYKGKLEKVCIICPKHGEFWLRAGAHLQGQGCPKCGNDRISNSRSLTKELWIEKANIVHHNKYDYSKVDYKGARNNVIIICPIHGEFEQNAGNHIRKNNYCGCPLCAKLHQKLLISSNTSSFINKASIIHNNKYDYSKVLYITAKDKVTIICPIHGEFLQAPNHHLEGSGCPHCSAIRESKGESFIRDCLVNYNINYILLYLIQINLNINLSGKAYIDFYLPDYNAFIEYNGIQHYCYSKYFHKGGIIDFERQLKRDEYVRNYCKENNINLLEIRYNDDILECLDEFILNIIGNYD